MELLTNYYKPMEKHKFQPVKEILVEMINAGIIGQSWLSDEEYQRKLDRKRKQIDQRELF